MSAPLCRCGREKAQHKPPRPEVCHGYDPMDFTPFDADLSGEDGMGCHCDLCSKLKYAHGRHENLAPHSRALHDGANHVGGDLGCNGRGYTSAGSFMTSGTGIGLTPGGVTGSTYREENPRKAKS